MQNCILLYIYIIFFKNCFRILLNIKVRVTISMIGAAMFLWCLKSMHYPRHCKCWIGVNAFAFIQYISMISEHPLSKVWLRLSILSMQEHCGICSYYRERQPLCENKSVSATKFVKSFGRTLIIIVKSMRMNQFAHASVKYSFGTIKMLNTEWRKIQH